MRKKLKAGIAAHGQKRERRVLQAVFVPLLNEHVINGQGVGFERRIDLVNRLQRVKN